MKDYLKKVLDWLGVDPNIDNTIEIEEDEPRVKCTKDIPHLSERAQKLIESITTYGFDRYIMNKDTIHTITLTDRENRNVKLSFDYVYWREKGDYWFNTDEVFGTVDSKAIVTLIKSKIKEANDLKKIREDNLRKLKADRLRVDIDTSLYKE